MRGSVVKISVFLLLLFTISVAFGNGQFTKYAETDLIQNIDDDGNPVVSAVEGPYNTSGLTLDEYIGDTLSIGYTWRDMQHNGSIGRMIAMAEDADGNLTAHFTWCGRESDVAPSETRYNRVYFADTDDWAFHTANGEDVDGFGVFGGYTVVDVDPETNRPYLSFHGQQSAGGEYIYRINMESSFLPLLFSPNYNPPSGESSLEWPHTAFAEYEGHKYFHMIANPADDATDGESFYYTRVESIGDSFANSTPDSDVPLLVTSYAMNLSAVPAASADGSKVALAGTIGRWLQRGSVPPDWTGLSQGDNDIYVWESSDGGDTWDFNDPINVTDFYPIDESYLPGDTTSANQDTLRAYTEVSLAYDDNNNLHLAYSAHEFDHIRGSMTRSARIFYWNNEAQEHIMVGDGSFFNGAINATWERLACHASISYETDNGVIWIMYQQSGEDGDTNDLGEPLDASDDGVANTDLYVTASFDGGHRFMKSVNVTNTRTMEPNLPAGDCRSEREPSMARNVEGGYLHLTYTLDFDAGTAVPPPTNGAEGEATLNRQIHQRVAKYDLVQKFIENQEYVTNYPLHIDSLGFYEDSNNWEWDSPLFPDYPDYSGSVGENPGNTLTPDEFSLAQNYPNPFNPSTEISFNLLKAGVIKLSVYDVLGREVAQLVNRQMSVGDHKVNFMASDLSSGVYFYKLTSGSSSQIRKMVLMK
jgi:Secretion system C-terminal sorting domain